MIKKVRGDFTIPPAHLTLFPMLDILSPSSYNNFMSKPILNVKITTPNEKKGTVNALFDTGSFYTIIRRDCFPEGGSIFEFAKAKRFGTAGQRGKIRIVGETNLVVSIGNRMINTSAFVSPDLKREMLIGAGTMQMWDITIRNRKGKTIVLVGRDMRDPEITEID